MAGSAISALGVRPESWHLAGEGEDGYPIKVAVVEELGADAFLYGTPATDVEVDLLRQIVVRVDARLNLTKGDVLRVHGSCA